MGKPQQKLSDLISDKVKSMLTSSSGGHNKEVGSESKDGVTFTINGLPYTVKATDEVFGPESRLVDFIRDRAGLKGTKWTCREGGCGVCLVTVRTKDVHTGDEVVRAVNSCLAPVWSCDGYDISTIEDLGNGVDGYHPIQKRLAQFSGSQCGFCSPGMVMNMYSLANAKSDGLTSQEVEDNFDGNICRCTGYRPIMDAMKFFAMDAHPQLKARCSDIEELCATCPAKKFEANGRLSTIEKGCTSAQKSKKNPTAVAKAAYGGCFGNCCPGSGCYSGTAMEEEHTNLPHFFGASFDLKSATGDRWVKAMDLKTVFDTLKNFTKNNLKYRIVAGNTGTGVFKKDGPYDAFLEINSVPELTLQSMTKLEATLGGATSLTRAIEFFQKLSTQPGFEFCSGLTRHIKRVANTPVRNFGTIAGNLMMKHAHPEFPSDIFLLMETLGAKIFVGSSPSKSDWKQYSPWDFLKVDMKSKVIIQLTIPARDFDHVFRSYKITKRNQNAHAYVNSGMLFKVDVEKNFKILEKPTLTFGGIRADFLHATKTEEALTGMELGNVESLKKALTILETEIQPESHLPDASPEYRRALCLGLLYKTVLGIVNGKGIKKNVQSGGQDLERKLHSGKQIFDIDEDKTTPLYKAVPKLEALYQVSGEAEYVNDLPAQVGELYGTFVRTTVAKAMLKSVDASEALKIPGVIKFLTAADIPGKNFIYSGFGGNAQEMLFVENKIEASGLAIGLIVAETQAIANMAAEKVKVEYEGQEKPVLRIKEAVEKARKDGSFDKLLYPIHLKSPDEPSKNSKHTIKGEFNIGSQAHFHMETHVTLCVRKEDGLMVYSATQWMDGTQEAIARVLNIPNNKISVEVRRLGGGFGGKISRSLTVAAAAALATHLTRRPVRVVIDLETNLEMMGKRLPYYAEYEAGFDDHGKIDALKAQIFCDTGILDAEGTSPFAAVFMQSCYNASGWSLQCGRTSSNTPINTFCRAPGTTQGVAIMENIIEHIADTLGKDSLEIRAANWLKTGDPLLPEPGNPKFEGINLVPSLVEEMKKIADYDERKKQVEEFNKNNRWRKRGLAMVPMRYLQGYHGFKFPSYVAVHNQDGTVSVSHGGIEMGQGINTKVAQVTAHVLGIPLSMVAIKPSNNLVSTNADSTGGAVTSELVSYATMRACQTILERMEPIKKAAKGELKWVELVQKCNKEGIDLRATHYYNHEDPVKAYEIYGCNLTEVEVDVLTGEFKVVRLDLIEDAGKSLSPEVDIGQIEGCVAMGLGLWSGEKLVHDPQTGRLLTRNTWEYKVPFPKDIPEDLRITIMRNAPNPFGVLRSKATGEPPLVLSVTVLFAIKNAIKSARKDAGNTDWFQLDGPVTPEEVAKLCLTSPHAQFDF